MITTKVASGHEYPHPSSEPTLHQREIPMNRAIDVWAQVMTERMARQPWLETLLRWTGMKDELVVPTPADAVKAMDAAGVSMALLSAWDSPLGVLISNQEVARQREPAP